MQEEKILHLFKLLSESDKEYYIDLLEAMVYQSLDSSEQCVNK